MNINQEGQEDHQARNPNPSPPADEVCKLKADQAKINQGEWGKKAEIIKDGSIRDERV
jgi:hypothetical protein